MSTKRPPFKRGRKLDADALQWPCPDDNCFLGSYPSGVICPTCNGKNVVISAAGYDVLRFVAENFDKVLTLRKAFLASEASAKRKRKL